MVSPNVVHTTTNVMMLVLVLMLLLQTHVVSKRASEVKKGGHVMLTRATGRTCVVVTVCGMWLFSGAGTGRDGESTMGASCQLVS